MSKRSFKVQASSSRAAYGSSGFGAFGGFSQDPVRVSTLSYLAEPPDLSSISDPNLVVILKNLTKRDATTKVKALEDLIATFEASKEVEDAVLPAWASLYPKTSIDNARRVRQLAHSVLGQIVALAGKRILKHMPKVVPAWLAGLYDNDRLASKAAQDAIQLVFPTPEKYAALRKLYQEPILEFILQVTSTETPTTLSDERVASPDEAEQKYDRLIAATIGLLASMLSEVPEAERQKHTNAYNELFENSKFWGFALVKDSSVRRTMHKLLKTYLHRLKTPSSSTFIILSTIYVYKGLESDQSSAGLDYVNGLVALTKMYPTVWTEHYSGKKPPRSRVRHMLQRGSQGSGPAYWSAISDLFELVPVAIWSSDMVDIAELLDTFLKGITKKDEPRTNHDSGFGAYLKSLPVLDASLTEGDRNKIVKDYAFPILSQFVAPKPDNDRFNIPPRSAPRLTQQTMSIQGISGCIANVLPNWSDELVREIEDSMTKSPNDSQERQKDLVGRGARLILIMASSSSFVTPESQAGYTDGAFGFAESLMRICAAFDGRPFSAAQTLADLLKHSDQISHDQRLWQSVDTFAASKIPDLIFSPSADALVAALATMTTRQSFQQCWQKTVAIILQNASHPIDLRATTLQKLFDIQRVKQDFGELNPLLHTFIDEAVSNELETQTKSAASGAKQTSLTALIGSLSLDTEFTDQALSRLVAAMSMENSVDKLENALLLVQHLSQMIPEALKKYLAADAGEKLLSRVLLLTEANDNRISTLAGSVSDKLGALHGDVTSKSNESRSSTAVILSNLETASVDSVLVDTLLLQAKKMLRSDPHIMESLIPSLDIWSDQLQMLLTKATFKCLALTNPLGGLLYPVQATSFEEGTKIPRDIHGLSIPLRMAMFVANLVDCPEEPARGCNPFKMLSIADQERLFVNMIMTTQLINENLSIVGSNRIFIPTSEQIVDDTVDFASKSQHISRQLFVSGAWWDLKENPSPTNFLQPALDKLFENAKGTTGTALANAEAYTTTMSEMIDIHGWKSQMTAALEGRLRDLRRSGDLTQLTAFILAHRVPLATSAVAARFLNELVSDMTGSNAADQPDECLRQLILTNAFIQNSDTLDGIIAKQRLIFFVKKVVKWLKEDGVSEPIQAESCKALTVILPLMRDIYGEHWEQLVSYISALWNSFQSLEENGHSYDLPLIHATLRLYSVLKKLASADDGNGDLQDELKDAEQALSTGLLNILILPRHWADDVHLPLRAVNELLQRQVGTMSKTWTKTAEPLYPLLLTPSRSLQEAAYNVLHSCIPSQQENAILEVELEKSTIRLPDELLSLVLEAPNKDVFQDDTFENDMPISLRGYLFSWLLIFDHFPQAVSRYDNYAF